MCCVAPSPPPWIASDPAMGTGVWYLLQHGSCRSAQRGRGWAEHMWGPIRESAEAKRAMPMSAHGLQADIPGMGWMKTFLFHVWALPSMMFLL